MRSASTPVTSASKSTRPRSISFRPAIRTWSASSTATPTCSVSPRSTSSKRSPLRRKQKSPAMAGLFLCSGVCSAALLVRLAVDAGAKGSGASSALRRSVAEGQQRRVATGRRRVHRDRLLGGEARQVVRAAGLRTGAGHVLPTERLHADHCADLVAVDVAVADLDARSDLLDRFVDARMHAE